MKEKIRYLIHGTGLIAEFHARAIREADGSELAGFAGRNAARLAELETKFGCPVWDSYETALRESDARAVSVATPSGLHLESVEAAAAAGKHVLCEKPLEVTTERIDRMIAVCAAAGVKLGCIFQLRQIPALAPIREALKAGRFGKVTFAGVFVPWWREQAYYDASSWHGRWSLDGGGALMNQAVHMVDLLCELFDVPDTVQAVASSLGHGIETEDAAVAALGWKNGMTGVVHATTSAWPGRAKRLEIFGTDGGVVLEDESLVQFRFRTELPEDAQIRYRFAPRDTHAAGAAAPGAMGHLLHAEAFRAFSRALIAGEEPACTGESARRSVALIERIYRSAGIR